MQENPESSEEKKYRILVLKTLNDFQMLEMLLKVYISVSYKIIGASLNSSIPFKYSYRDIENYPLERLINVFAKHNDNIDLQNRLNKLREGRNKLAHKALLISHDIFRELLSEKLDDNYESVKTMEKEVNACMRIIESELEKHFIHMKT